MIDCMSARAQAVSALARRICSSTADHPLRVGIEGVCGSGKSILAGELTMAISRRGRPAVHVDSDGFHNLRETRYRQGRDSARGCSFEAVATAPRDTIVIFDCAILRRGRLRDFWDVVIYLDVRRDIALARGVARDPTALGGVALARRAYDDRYMAAWDIYVREEHPAERASIVINHDNVEAPRFVRGIEAGEPS